jgi:hypothetical protein
MVAVNQLRKRHVVLLLLIALAILTFLDPGSIRACLWFDQLLRDVQNDDASGDEFYQRGFEAIAFQGGRYDYIGIKNKSRPVHLPGC